MVLTDGATRLVSGVILLDKRQLRQPSDEVRLCFVEGFCDELGRQRLLDVFRCCFFQVVEYDVYADPREPGAGPAEAVEHIDRHSGLAFFFLSFGAFFGGSGGTVAVSSDR